jgi:hypothetical protein
MIRTISTRHSIRGYDRSPIEADQVVEFTTKLTELRRKQNAETERIQVSTFLYGPALHCTEDETLFRSPKEGSRAKNTRTVSKSFIRSMSVMCKNVTVFDRRW